MAALRLARLVRNRDRKHRNAGATRRRDRARKLGVEALEHLCLLSLSAPPPIDEFALPAPNGLGGVATGPDGAI
jgi:hypothetical protein